MLTATREFEDPVRSAISLFEGMPTLPAILKLLRDQTDLRFVGIARVTPERWLTCAVLDDVGLGLKVGDELDVTTTLCRAQLSGPHTIAIDDAHMHPLYGDHPAPRLYGFRSHVSVPICLADGSYFGSLCGLDPEPRLVANTRGVTMMEHMAVLIGRLVDEALSHVATQQALVAEREVSDSCEQFIAVVAHDLRTPLGAMQTAAEILVRAGDERGSRIGERLRKSADRMTDLIDDLVDFSRGRAGRAMPVELVQFNDHSHRCNADDQQPTSQSRNPKEIAEDEILDSDQFSELITRTSEIDKLTAHTIHKDYKYTAVWIGLTVAAGTTFICLLD